MSFRKKRTVLLSAVVILLMLSILDISIRKDEGFEAFGEQFLNERKTDTYTQAHKGVRVTDERKVEINGKGIKEVTLASVGGKISVKRSEDSVVRLQYNVTVTAPDENAANRKREAVKVIEEVEDGRLTLVTQANGRAIDRDSVSIDYDLHIPDAMKLKVENEGGAVRISGTIGNVDATSKHGLMEIVGVKGEVTVESSEGSLNLSDIMGNIALRSNYSHANIDLISGSVVLSSQAGQTIVSNIQGEVTGDAEFGPVYLREITGSVEFNSRGADIQLDQIRGDTRMISESGHTTFIMNEADGYVLDASVSGGTIHTLLPLPIKQDQDRDYEAQLNGVIGDGTWKVDIKAWSGDVNFQVK